MDSKEYLEELHKKLNISKYILLHYISLVGANEENIIDYALNADCAVVRKDKGFEISYTAKMINDKDQRIADLEAKLAELKEKAIVPRFKYKDYVYAIYSDRDIFKGQIDIFDYYTKEYLVFFSEDIGNDWFSENLLFATEQEAQEKLKEIQGNE